MRMKKLFSLLCAAAITLSAVGGLPASAEASESVRETTEGTEGNDPWQANFLYDEETGILSWDNCLSVEETYGDSSIYAVYVNGCYLTDTIHEWSGETLDIVLPQILADHVYFHGDELFTIKDGIEIAYKDVFTGDLTITAGAGNYNIWIGSSDSADVISSDSFSFSYDGCDLNHSLGTPTNIQISNEVVTWDPVDSAVGYLTRITGDIGVRGGSRPNATDYANNWVFGWSGNESYSKLPVGDYLYEVCAVDKNGDRGEWSEPFTYTVESPELKTWQANFRYNQETGILSWDPCEEADEYFSSKKESYFYVIKEADTGFEAWSFRWFNEETGMMELTPEIKLPLVLAYENYKGRSVAGNLTFSSVIIDPAGSSYTDCSSVDTFTYQYDGCDVNPALQAPQNIRTSSGNPYYAVWDKADGAIGYLIEFDNFLDQASDYIYNERIYSLPDRFTNYNEDYIGKPQDGFYQFKICSVDKNGNRSEWSDYNYLWINNETETWEANFKYNEETGLLSWDRNPKIDDAHAAKKEDFFYVLHENYYGASWVGNCYMSYSENGYRDNYESPFGVTLPLELAYHELAGLSPTLVGTLIFNVSGNFVYYGSEDNDPFSSDSFYYSYDGCDLNPSLGVPSNIWNLTETVFGYSDVENAVGYVIRYTGSDGIAHYTSSDTGEVWYFADFQEGATLPDGDYAFEVCAIDNKGDHGKWSEPVTFNIVDKKFTNIPLTYPENITINAAGDLIWEAAGATGYIVSIRGENAQLTERTTEKALKDLTEVLKNQADGNYTITVTAFNDSGIERTGETPFTFTKVSEGFFNEENKKEPAAVTVDEAEKEIATAIPADDKVESVIINPAFNLQLKEETLAAVGELDLEKIEIKAKEIFSEEPINKAKEAIARKLADGEGNSDSENRQVILMDLSLWHGANDISEQYEGLVQVSISIPKNQLGKEISLWRLNDNNGIIEPEEIEGEISEDGKFYIVYLEHFSEYALVADGGETPAPSKQGFYSDGTTLSDAAVGTTVTQKTEAQDGKYNVRFIQKVNADTLTGKSKATFTLTANGVTKEVSTTKYYTGLTFDDGTKATAASGQVFLCYTVTGVPENVSVTASRVVLE